MRSRLRVLSLKLGQCFALLVVLFAVQGKDDGNEWVDPMDMLSYDPISKTNTKYGLKTQNCDCNLNAVNYLEECEKLLGTNSLMKVDKEDTNLTYLRRFIGNLLLQFDSADEVQHYHVSIKLNAEDKKKLKNFIDSQKISLHEVNSILSKLFINSYPVNQDGEYDYLSNIDPKIKDIFMNILIAITLFLLLNLILNIPIYKTVIILFFCGSFWQWQLIYQEKLAVQQAEMMKNPNIPEECRPKDLTWSQRVMKWWNQEMQLKEDVCHNYYKQIKIDPFWSVSPTLAVSQMFAQFFTSPMTILGTNLGIFFKNLHANLPPLMIFIVMPFLVILVFTILFTCCGYSIRGFGWRIGPEVPPRIASHQMRPGIEELSAPGGEIKKVATAVASSSVSNSEVKCIGESSDVKEVDEKGDCLK